MLQQVEYDPRKFLNWIERLIKDNKSVQSVMTRKKLVKTPKAYALLVFSYSLIAVNIFGYIFMFRSDPIVLFLGNFLLVMLIAPFVVQLSLSIITFIAYRIIILPQKKRLIAESKKIFAQHKAVKIAVIGSYGKTTMKELLKTIIGQAKDVAATPGNMNVAVSHARFAKKLTGKEDVLVVEFGEGEPGDVMSMSKTLKPDYAVITGLAPNHLDHYSDLETVASDLLSVYDVVKKDHVYVTNESMMLKAFLPKDVTHFSATSVMGWKISNVLVSVVQTTFTMTKGKKKLSIQTGLLGRHQIAPIAFGAAIADKLGLSTREIEQGCMEVLPFEHRMQPRHIHGAWLIDDTYNGNLEGLQAGLKLLHELDMKRKWYVTPGLVDQGSETERVHKELGKSIAESHADIVVLMDNSVRPIIEESMKENGFAGELRIESNPLQFYRGIEHIVAAGDLVVMQNDWTDNYN